jgi:hypothetical protein
LPQGDFAKVNDRSGKSDGQRIKVRMYGVKKGSELIDD